MMIVMLSGLFVRDPFQIGSICTIRNLRLIRPTCRGEIIVSQVLQFQSSRGEVELGISPKRVPLPMFGNSAERRSSNPARQRRKANLGCCGAFIPSNISSQHVLLVHFSILKLLLGKFSQSSQQPHGTCSSHVHLEPPVVFPPFFSCEGLMGL